MPRLNKVFVFVLPGILVVAGLALLSANIYVQNAASQSRIENRLGRILKLPVKISHTSLRPWGSLHVAGVTAPQTAPASGNFLEIGGLTADFQLMPVLNRHLVMETLVIDEPRISWRQNEKGRWVWPKHVERPQEPKPETKPAGQPSVPPKAPRKSFDLDLRSVRLEGGSFDFSNASGAPVAQLSKVNIECPVFDSNDLTGRLTSQEAVLGKSFLFQNLRAPFRYTPQGVQLHPMEADLAGGRFQGKLEIEHAKPGAPFTAEAELNGVDSNRLLEEAVGWSDRLSGALSGTLALNGNMAESKSLAGRGHIEMANGRIRKSNLLATLGQAMRIDELIEPEFKNASADFNIGDDKIQIEQLFIQCVNLSLQATGTVKFNTKLDLKAVLTINEKISRHLPNFVLSNLQPGPEPGQLVIAFDVKGTTSKPSTNLVDRLLGQKIEDEVSGLFQSLFGKKKKKEDKP